MTTVGFRGLPHIAQGDSFFAPPFGGPVHDGVMGWAPGDEAEFTGAIAEQHGRSCGGTRCTTKACSGDCYARDYVEGWNARYPDLTGDEAPFYLGTRAGTTPAKRGTTRAAARNRAGTKASAATPKAGTPAQKAGTTRPRKAARNQGPAPDRSTTPVDADGAGDTGE